MKKNKKKLLVIADYEGKKERFHRFKMRLWKMILIGACEMYVRFFEHGYQSSLQNCVLFSYLCLFYINGEVNTQNGQY